MKTTANMSLSMQSSYDTVGRNGRSLHGQRDTVESDDDQYWVVKPAVTVESSTDHPYAKVTTTTTATDDKSSIKIK